MPEVFGNVDWGLRMSALRTSKAALSSQLARVSLTYTMSWPVATSNDGPVQLRPYCIGCAGSLLS